MHRPAKRNTFWTFWLPAAAIILLGFTLRLVKVMRLPLFLDEALHIYRAHRAMAGDLFVGNIRKWFYPVALSLLRPGGPEGPWLARGSSALLAALVIAGVIGMGRALDKRQTGLLAGLFYAVLPLAIFHERQALADPLLAALTTLVILSSIWLARRPRWWMAPLMGLAFAGAYLTKIAALPFAAVPAAAIILLSPDGKTRLRGALLAVAAGLIAAVPVAYAYRQYIAARWIDTSTAELSTANITGLIGPGQPGYLGLLPYYLRDYGQALWLYVGAVLLVFILLALGWALLGERRRAILFLALPGVGIALVPLLAVSPADFFTARYILPNAPPLVVLGALGLLITLECRPERHQRAGRWVSRGLVAAAALYGLVFAALLMRTPAHAPLTTVDRAQYFNSDPGGAGREEAAGVLLADWRAGSEEPINVMVTGESFAWVDAMLGPRVGEFLRFRSGDPELEPALVRWLADGEQVYLLEETETLPLPDAPFGARLRTVGVFESGAGPLRLVQITGLDGPLAAEVYTHLSPEPDKLVDDYGALGAALAQTGSIETPILVFPGEYAGGLLARLPNPVVTLTPESWPMDAALAGALLADALPGVDGAPVEVIVADEAHTDPQRNLLLALHDHLFYRDDSYFGLLHRWSAVTGPAEVPASLPGGQYENVLELTGGAILDEQVHPGGVVRVVMEWLSPVAVQDSFVVFAHVINAEGALHAQHDGVPGAGLLPMTAWTPGEPVTDRFAISLPGDLAPGEYEIRVGLYHPESGLRLAATGGSERGADYLVLGRITVTP